MVLRKVIDKLCSFECSLRNTLWMDGMCALTQPEERGTDSCRWPRRVLLANNGEAGEERHSGCRDGASHEKGEARAMCEGPPGSTCC